MNTASTETRTRALNRLLAAAQADSSTHILCMQSNCILEPDCLIHLMRMSVATGHAALIEGTQFPDELPKYFNPQTLETPWASDACLLIPTRMLEELHGFDEDFSDTGGDIDLSWRARALGWQVLTCPTALFGYPAKVGEHNAAPLDQASTSLQLLKVKWQHRSSTPRDADTLSRQRKPGIAQFEFGANFALNRW